MRDGEYVELRVRVYRSGGDPERRVGAVETGGANAYEILFAALTLINGVSAKRDDPDDPLPDIKEALHDMLGLEEGKVSKTNEFKTN